MRYIYIFAFYDQFFKKDGMKDKCGYILPWHSLKTKGTTFIVTPSDWFSRKTFMNARGRFLNLF